MSVEAITWALKTTVSHSSAKFVLVILANCANAETLEAYPSIAYISEATEQDRKTVIANLKRLIESGHISDTGRRTGSTGSIVIYRVSCTENGTSKQSQKRDDLDKQAVPFFPTSSTEIPYKQSRFSAEAVPKTGHGTVSEPSTTKSKSTTTPSGELFPDVSDQVISDFKAMRKSMKAAITQTAIDGIVREAKVAGITLEAALTLCCERNWRSFKAEWLANSKPSTVVSWQDKRQANDDATNRALYGIQPERLVQGVTL